MSTFLASGIDLTMPWTRVRVHIGSPQTKTGNLAFDNRNLHTQDVPLIQNVNDQHRRTCDRWFYVNALDNVERGPNDSRLSRPPSRQGGL